MTQVFTEDGRRVPVTVIQAGPCTVLRVKTPESDGYAAVQLGFEAGRKAAKRPQQAYFDKIDVATQRFVREVPFVDSADVIGADGDGEVAPGAQIGVTAFKEIEHVDVRGVTKGRGFTGTVKRHGFRTGDKSHGSKNVREPGSTGMHTDPGRVLKGKKMAGQHGNKNRKVRNLRVIRIDEEDQLLVVEGAVPGPRGGYLLIEESL